MINRFLLADRWKNPARLFSAFAFLYCCAILFINGCSPKIAPVDLPFESKESFSLAGETSAPDRWWQAFRDEELNRLIEQALETNLSLNAVWYQFEEAGALVDITSSVRWPELFLQLQSGISVPEPDFVGGENTQLSLRSNYEVDLWGRIRYSVHAEAYRFQASFYDFKTAAISIAGEIALTWFRLKTATIQLQVLNEQVETNEKVLALIRARFASGQVRGVDILRQQQLIENTKEQRIVLESQMGLLSNQLATLLGQPPGITFQVSPQLPDLPLMPETGIPLELVNRRPDVLGAYYRLQASDREVAAAVSNKYPRLNFSLTAALRSNTLIGLFDSQALSISSSLLAPIFYGGRLNAELDRTEAVRQQLLNDYGQTVLEAFREIEDALIQEKKQVERIEYIEKQLTLAEQSFDQLRIEYLNGSIAYLDVLVTLNQQQQLRRDLIDAQRDLLEFRVALYRALAGGFETQKEIQLEENFINKPANSGFNN